VRQVVKAAMFVVSDFLHTIIYLKRPQKKSDHEFSDLSTQNPEAISMVIIRTQVNFSYLYK